MARDMSPDGDDLSPTDGGRDIDDLLDNLEFDPVANRVKWLAALRQQGHRQCVESYESNGLVCALGLLREVSLPGWSITEQSVWDDVGEVGSLAGLTDRQAYDVTHLNDGTDIMTRRRHTFAEIADVVEGWFR